jgi:hypothetical protein
MILPTVTSRKNREAENGSKHSPWRRWAEPVGVLLAILGVGLAVYDIFFRETAALTEEEVRLEDRRPPTIATNCRPYDPGFDPRYQGLSTADLKCEPIGSGPESVRFHLFTNEADLKEYMRLQRSAVARDGTACTTSGFPYASSWVDREGRTRGELLCADYSNDSRLVWSHRETLVVGTVLSAPGKVDQLHSWWQREVKFDGRFQSPSARRHLRALLPADFRDCHPMRLLAPAAIAGFLCRPGGGINVAGAELFANRRTLSAYLDNHANHPGIDEEGCRDSPFSYTTYGLPPDYRPAVGRLLCRPENGVEWFEWIAFEPLVYAFASREDSDSQKLYEQWSSSLSQIRGLSWAQNAGLD